MNIKTKQHYFVGLDVHLCFTAVCILDPNGFHVVQAFGKVIDEIRREEYFNATLKDRMVMKGSHYLLLRNSVNLSAEQRGPLFKETTTIPP